MCWPYLYPVFHNMIGKQIFMAQNRSPNATDLSTYKSIFDANEGFNFAFLTEDGIRLFGTHFRAQSNNDRSKTIILVNGTFFHYEEYVARRLFNLKEFLDNGFNVLLFNNRCVVKKYESPQGTVTKPALTLDCRAAINHVLQRYKVAEADITVHMHSLGAGYCLEAASGYNVQICLDRTFSRLSSVLEYRFGSFLGKIVTLVASHFGWEYDVKAMWDVFKGKKWAVSIAGDQVIGGAAFANSLSQKEKETQVLQLDQSEKRDPHTRGFTCTELKTYLKFANKRS